MVVSKTKMLELVKGFRAAEVDAALKENPGLRDVRDARGRNWLHICCGQKVKKGQAKDSIQTAEVLLKHGFDPSEPAFVEGSWKAVPVWFAIGRGENLALAEWLMKRGGDPNHSLWAASFRGDLAAIRLLVKYGASLEQIAEDSTPFIGAVGYSKFAAAEELLKLGANPDAVNSKGMTALHLMLKKGSDAKHIAMVVRHGARGDIADNAGVTAVHILRRKRDPALRKLAGVLAARA
ncbi:MAG: hypothetical protein ISS15_12195 [Alphaproteobacteria bacterium]|nr:hypothetical protein [Alphaproteobacteria bacterium]MBL6936538.1 hypothetical protein [Alphaproteobacteria bacterium]MBL7098411.1 hypothetical protein [Alphaproteobacteria bacterium]